MGQFLMVVLLTFALLAYWRVVLVIMVAGLIALLVVGYDAVSGEVGGPASSTVSASAVPSCT